MWLHLNTIYLLSSFLSLDAVFGPIKKLVFLFVTTVISRLQIHGKYIMHKSHSCLLNKVAYGTELTDT